MCDLERVVSPHTISTMAPVEVTLVVSDLAQCPALRSLLGVKCVDETTREVD